MTDAEGSTLDSGCSNPLAITTTGSKFVCACALEMVAKIPAQASATLVGLKNIG
jgi:hypothetical protein